MDWLWKTAWWVRLLVWLGKEMESKRLEGECKLQGRRGLQKVNGGALSVCWGPPLCMYSITWP